MRFRALIIAIKSRQHSNLLKSEQISENRDLDFMFFDDVEEFPQRIDWNVYANVIILPVKLTGGLHAYLEKLVVTDSTSKIHVICSVNKPRFYQEFGRYKQICLWESSEEYASQIQYIFELSRKDWAANQTITQQARDYKLTISQSPVPVVVFDFKGMVKEVNKPFSDLFQYQQEDVVGYPINKVIPDISVEKLNANNRLKLQHIDDLTNLTYLNSKGEYLHCSASILLRNFDQQPAFILYILNQTEQYSLQQLLDKRNDLILSLSYVINLLSTSPEFNFNNKKLIDLLRRIFGCDYIYINEVKKDFRSGKYKILISRDHKTEKKLISKFHQVIESTFEQEELYTYHPDPIETLTSEKGLKIKTLITYPLQIADTLYGVINLFFLNNFDPEPFLTSFIKIIGKTIALSEVKTIMHQRSADASPQFDAIIKNALDGIYQTTPDGRFIFANPALIQLLKYDSLEDISSIDITKDLYNDPAERGKFQSYIEKYGEVKNFITELKTKDNKAVTVLEQAHLVETEEGRTYYEGFIRDITQFKEMEQQLKHSENFAEELIEQANFMIAVVNKKREIIVWNNRAESITGYSRTEMIGKALFGKGLFPEKSAASLARKHLKADNANPLELSLLTKSAQEIIVSLTGGTLHSIAHGETEVWFGTDITHIRELEKGFQETEKMQRQNLILNRMTESLNHILSEIQSEISFFHDAEPEPIKLKQSMERIEKALADVAKLRNTVQTITGTSDINPVIINPNNVIEEVVTILHQIKPAQMEFSVELKNNAFAEIDRSKFNQVLMNIAVNAFEAAAEPCALTLSSTSIRAEQDRYLRNLADPSQRYIKIVFTDNGKGMNEETRLHALEPFFTTKTDSPVRGLGLTYSYQVITHHHGYMNIESEPDLGTSVSIYLPAIKKDKEETKRMGTPGKKGTILVVDDEIIIRELLTDILKSEGYRVLTAENGKEGIALYKKNRRILDLIILDIIMPEMDGKQVFERIKKIDPEARVLVTSGYSKSKVRDELLQQGVDGFLPKPFDIEALKQQLENIL